MGSQTILIVFFISFLIMSVLGFDNSTLVVDTSNGPVRGQLFSTILENKPYYSYKGIPYAKAPSYDLRFLPPAPHPAWTEPRDCFNFGNVCLQYNPLNKTELIGDEDCLFLNVYTPDTRPNILKTVMVYIHGGGWFFGSGNDDLQGPDLLINEDVVLVTINYRLGVLGFMSLGTRRYSGNQGLKDQQLALQWINQNIHNFGGNKNKITLFGQSAGSSSCMFHILAPTSKGLFQQTIQMSFTFDIWSVYEKGEHMDDMYWMAHQNNANASNHKELLQFLTSVPGELFTTTFPIVQFHPSRIPVRISSHWLPVLENSKALHPFLQVSPVDILLESNLSTNINVMTGYTSQEGLFFATPDTLHPSDLDALDKRFEVELPSMRFNGQYNSTAYKRVAKQIREMYFPTGINANWNTLQNFAKLISNIYENYQIDRRVKMLSVASSGKTYYYNFGLISQFNYYKTFYNAEGEYGALHADDLCYVFKCNVVPTMYTNITVGSFNHGMIKTMTGLYSNFAKFGNPRPQGNPWWNPVRIGHIEYLNIGENGLHIGFDPMLPEIQFWQKLLDENPELLTNDLNKYSDSVLKKYGILD